jgi:hypothetical protein
MPPRPRTGQPAHAAGCASALAIRKHVARRTGWPGNHSVNPACHTGARDAK